MISKVEVYLSHLWELGKKEFSDLTDSNCEEFASRLALETPLKMLPLIENYDADRVLITLVSKWMIKPSEDLQEEMIDQLVNLTTKAMLPLIEDRMIDYAKREAIAIRETTRNEILEGHSFDKQRI